MAKLSIIIPSRDERFLIHTIDDIFRNARADDTEVIAVLDSDKWPEEWKEVADRHPRLHTIHHGQSKGMRAAINSGVGSAISRGAKFIAKFDGHCSFSEGFDEVLKAECEPNWIVVPRRGRLDPENWCETELHKPPIDYHYLSFPDDPNDFGGPGLNGKVWAERAIERKDILLDEEMSSQGSGWFMHSAYFTELELMDEASYGPFWNEFQEIGLKCWLSGGRVMVNKKAKYLHLHKGKKYGRGYHLPESWLKQGRNHAMLWPWNEAWPKQTLPFSWLIEHFQPVPSWPENWEEVLYATRRPRSVGDLLVYAGANAGNRVNSGIAKELPVLRIHKALYGVSEQDYIDVTTRLQSLVKDNSLDIVVNNSTLTPDQNPFRGRKKTLNVTYSFDGDENTIFRSIEEKDWLIIGPSGNHWKAGGWSNVPESLQEELKEQLAPGLAPESAPVQEVKRKVSDWWGKPAPVEIPVTPEIEFSINAENRTSAQIQQVRQTIAPKTAAALNDFLIRKFSISPQRLRGPMPIELRDFHRNDLAQLFAELGFKRGAEIGVAEGKYSEVLMKANPDLELLLVDPWHAYSDNPQNKTKEKNEFAFHETKRRVEALGGSVGQMIMKLSMDAVRDVDDDSLDFCYIDGHHGFDYVMQDLIEWSKRVRSGGIVSGDDFYQLDQKRWIGGGVVEAVQAYTNAHRIPVWYIFQGHKSTDFMWVRP